MLVEGVLEEEVAWDFIGLGLGCDQLHAKLLDFTEVASEVFGLRTTGEKILEWYSQALKVAHILAEGALSKGKGALLLADDTLGLRCSVTKLQNKIQTKLDKILTYLDFVHLMHRNSLSAFFAGQVSLGVQLRWNDLRQLRQCKRGSSRSPLHLSQSALKGRGTTSVPLVRS